MTITPGAQKALTRLAEQIGYAEQVEYTTQGGNMYALVAQGAEGNVRRVQMYVTPIRGGWQNGHAKATHGNRRPRTAAEKAAQSRRMKAYWRAKRNG